MLEDFTCTLHLRSCPTFLPAHVTKVRSCRNFGAHFVAATSRTSNGNTTRKLLLRRNIHCAEHRPPYLMIRFLHYITTCGRSYYPCAKATGAMASLTLPMAPPKLMLMLLLSLVRGDMRGGHPEPDKSKTCWYPNGQQASNHYPCSSQLPGVCCSVNSVCMSNGLCLNADFTSYTEGTCTNSTWEVSTCPDFCSKGKRLSTPRI